jgi:uncharacterized protein
MKRDNLGEMRIGERLRRLDWRSIEAALWERGFARTPPVLTAAECRDVIALYEDDRHFRKRIDMERLRFGIGDYKYFRDPLPALVRELRLHGYRYLAPIANRWLEALGQSPRFPSTLPEFRAECAARDQTQPTPLVLRYESGGYNRLHQDLYGDLAFPLQMTCFLSRPGEDFAGGQFLLVESEARAQSRAEVIPGELGEMVIFPTRERPVRGKHRVRRARMRHGLARVESGSRYALGIIFHDASK